MCVGDLEFKSAHTVSTEDERKESERNPILFSFSFPRFLSFLVPALSLYFPSTFPGTISESICKLPNLQILDLSSNDLTGVCLCCAARL